MVFTLPCHLSRQKGVFKLSKKAYFLLFLDVWALCPKFLRRLKGELCYNLRDQLPLFCFMSEFGREECSKLWKWSFFSIFSPLSLFSQVFEQVKERLILELHEMIKVPEAVACQIVFILFYDRDRQGGIFKVLENDLFLLCLAGWVLFPMFLGRWRSRLY